MRLSGTQSRTNLAGLPATQSGTQGVYPTLEFNTSLGEKWRAVCGHRSPSPLLRYFVRFYGVESESYVPPQYTHTHTRQHGGLYCAAGNIVIKLTFLLVVWRDSRNVSFSTALYIT